MLVGKTLRRIRLEDIDCPERGQAFGSKAKELTSNLLGGKVVEVQSKGKDRYHRDLSQVFAGTVHLNAGVLRTGLAWTTSSTTKILHLPALGTKPAQPAGDSELTHTLSPSWMTSATTRFPPHIVLRLTADPGRRGAGESGIGLGNGRPLQCLASLPKISLSRSGTRI